MTELFWIVLCLFIISLFIHWLQYNYTNELIEVIQDLLKEKSLKYDPSRDSGDETGGN